MVEQPGNATLLGRQLGNYAVKALLGRGATGTVYLAKDTALGRPVALKVLLGSLARSKDQVERFLQEAKAVAPLQHPHIVGVYEAGIREGTPFIAMEYIEGEVLDRFLRRQGPLNWRHAFYIAAQVTEALQCAHTRGLVHRDVKPANVLLDRLGHVRLTDFGIARVQQGAIQRGQGYAVFGTPDYMAPEQCGVPVPIGPRSDFFSLGVMLYQMIAGAMPFHAQSTPAMIQRIVNDVPVRLNKLRDDVPDDVARLVAALMEKSPDNRPADAQAVLLEIRRIQQHDGDASALPEALNAFIRETTEAPSVRADTPLPGERRSLRIRAEKKRYVPVSVLTHAFLVALLLIGIVGVSYWHLVEAPQPRREAAVLSADLMRTDNLGQVWARLPDPRWIIEAIQWIGTDNVALVSVRGRDGTAVHGSRGLLAIDPENGVVRSVAAPVGPMTDTDFVTSKIVAPRPGAWHGGNVQSPLANAFVTPYPHFTHVGREGGGLIQALAQRWDESEPDARTVLFSLDAAWCPTPTTADVWRSEAPSVPVALHPDGRTLCLLLHDPERGTNYLAERDYTWKNLSRVGPRRTTTTESIEPDTFEYSRDGRHLAYYRQPVSGERSLWLIDLADGSPNGMPLATGEIKGHAFSPDGRQIAVCRQRNGHATVTIVDIESGQSVGDGGLGDFRSAAWHPTEDYLLVKAPDVASVEDQLWAVTTTAPFERMQLTHFESGIQWHPVVSQDGTWIATVADRDEGPAVVFLRWNSIQVNFTAGNAA